MVLAGDIYYFGDNGAFSIAMKVKDVWEKVYREHWAACGTGVHGLQAGCLMFDLIESLLKEKGVVISLEKKDVDILIEETGEGLGVIEIMTKESGEGV